jgi:hypothetical protein
MPKIISKTRIKSAGKQSKWQVKKKNSKEYSES